MGAAIGIGLAAGLGPARPGESQQTEPGSMGEAAQSPAVDRSATNAWQYVKLDRAAIARDAYRLMGQGGGCM